MNTILTGLVRKTIDKYLQQRKNAIFFAANDPQVNGNTGELSAGNIFFRGTVYINYNYI